MTPPGSKPIPSVARRIARVLVLFVAILVVGVLVLVQDENKRGRREWQQYRAEAGARGEKLDPADFIPPPIPDHENFAATPLLAPLFDYEPGTQVPRDSNAVSVIRARALLFGSANTQLRTRANTRSNSWIDTSADLAGWYATALAALSNSTPNSSSQSYSNWTRTELATAVVETIALVDPELRELRSAAERPKCRFALRYEEDCPASVLLPHLSILRHYCRVLKARACALLALGRRDEAFSDIQLMLRLGEVLQPEPIVVSQLSRMDEVTDWLQPIAEGMSQWSDSQLEYLQRRLAGINFPADVRHSLEAERVMFGNGVIDYVSRAPNRGALTSNLGIGDGGNNTTFPILGALMTMAPVGWYEQEKITYSREFEKYVLPIIDPVRPMISPATARRADNRVELYRGSSGAGRFLAHRYFSNLLEPSTLIAVRTAFAQSAVNLASIACALERYRRQHGDLPATLESLLLPAGSFLPQLPHDLINARPLLYRRLDATHFQIYSVGWNEVDDGGIVDPKASFETEKLKVAEGDWVWQYP